MSDTDLKGQELADEQTASPVPSEEKPIEGSQEPTLPDGVKERTAEEFEKLKESNRLLKEELDAAKANSFQFIPPMLDGSQPNQDFDTEVPNPSAGSTTSNEQDFVDEGGYVDTARLNSTLKNLQRDAEEARKEAQEAKRIVQQETANKKIEAIKRQAFSEFKEHVAENGESFSPEFDYKVKLELTRQLIETGKQDYMEAARAVQKNYYPKTEEVAEKEEIISSREQATAQTGASKGSQEPIDHDALVEGTMKGDADALYKRLQASGY